MKDELPLNRKIDFERFLDYVEALDEHARVVFGIGAKEVIPLGNRVQICVYAGESWRDHARFDYVESYGRNKIDELENVIEDLKSDIRQLKARIRRSRNKKMSAAKREIKETVVE